jgi:hypothetical protein
LIALLDILICVAGVAFLFFKSFVTYTTARDQPRESGVPRLDGVIFPPLFIVCGLFFLGRQYAGLRFHMKYYLLLWLGITVFAILLNSIAAIAGRERSVLRSLLRKSRMFKWFGDLFEHTLLSHSEGMLRGMQDSQLLQLETLASEAVGKIMEAYRASNAKLYRFDALGTKVWRVVSLNDSTAPQIMDLERKSITTHVVKTKIGYNSEDVRNDEHYLRTDPRTHSEIAVPVKFHDEILGVLTLESHKASTFLAEQIPDLEKRSLRLTPLLLLLRAYAESDGTALPLTFKGLEWGLSSILSPLCMEACLYFEECYGNKPSCTVWEYEADKQCFHARVAVGFDYEYRISKTLPRSGTFTGEMFDKPDGYVFFDALANIRTFLRREKAEDVGLTHVASTPLSFPLSATKYGVLSFYFFERTENIRTRDVREFATLIANIIEGFNLVTPLVAEAFVVGLLINSNVATHARFNLLREITQSILQSEYCSIFVLDPRRNFLRCVSTTGLMRGDEFVDIHQGDVGYSMEPSTSGFTVTVARSPGMVLRKNESQDELEPVIDGEPLMPSKTLVEAVSRDVLDHRRILIASVFQEGFLEGRAIGVVRLNRSGVRAPFIKSDEATLLAICRAAQNIFVNAVENPEMFGLLGRMQRDGSAVPGIVPIISNLLQWLPTRGITVEAFLQEVFHRLLTDAIELRGKHLHLLLRRVVRLEDQEALDVYYSLSTRAKTLKASEPSLRTRADGGIAWKCIENECPISFNTKDVVGVFKAIHEFSEDVKSGINLPFDVWNSRAAQLDKWVLCLDFETECEHVREYIQVLLLIIRKLQHLLTIDSQPRQFFPNENIHDLATRVAARVPHCNRVETHLNAVHGRTISHTVDRKADDSSESDRVIKEISLMFASLTVGRVHLIGVPRDDTTAYTNAVYDSWNMSGVSSPSTQWVFDLSSPRPDGGMQMWPNRGLWNGAEAFAGN